MIFQAERLYIRKLTYDDLHDLHKLQSNPNVMKYIINRPKTMKENEKELNKIIQHYSETNNEFLVLAVCSKETHEFIGTCAVIKNENNEFEVGYRILEELWGNGYGSEILNLIISYSSELRRLDYIVASVDAENIHSIKILEKCGFTLVNETVDEEIGEIVKYYSRNINEK